MKKKDQEPAGFGERLAQLRQERGLSQGELAAQVGVHPVQLRRYELGASEPTLHVLQAMAKALRVGGDVLLFGVEPRGADGDLTLLFEAVGGLDAEEKKAVRLLLEAVLVRHEARTKAKPRRRGRPRKGGSSS